MAKGWTSDSVRHGLSARGLSSGHKAKDTPSSWANIKTISDKPITNREKANFHRREALNELKKEKPDYEAVRYHTREAGIYARKRGIFKVVWKE